MNELDINYWDYDDGSVGAKIANVPGDIWARDEITLFSSIHAVCTAIENAEQTASGTRKPRLLDMGMQAAWIDGEYTVRFLPLPGFGVSFTSEDGLQTWIAHLVKTVATPAKIKTHD